MKNTLDNQVAVNRQVAQIYKTSGSAKISFLLPLDVALKIVRHHNADTGKGITRVLAKMAIFFIG